MRRARARSPPGLYAEGISKFSELIKRELAEGREFPKIAGVALSKNSARTFAFPKSRQSCESLEAKKVKKRKTVIIKK